MFKAILLDLDNTLVDFMKMKKKSCNAAINAMIKHGLHLSKPKAEKQLFKLYEEHGIEDQTIFQKFLKKTTGKIDYRLLAEAITAYRKAQFPGLKPYKTVIPTLKKLRGKGLKLAIVSDAPKLKLWLRLSEMGLSDFFDAVFALEDTRREKPHPRPFKKALRTLGIKPKEALFVGDWPERDILGAKKVGMKTCLAKYGLTNPVKGIKADYEIDSFKELLYII